MRTSLIVSLIAGVAIACAAESQKQRDRLDYCDCQMWGVMGVDPGPDYRPPPLPAKCKRILARGPEQDCPVPP